VVSPTHVAADQCDVRSHLAKVAATSPKFPLRLRGTATFRPTSPVVFVALSEGISTCELLAEAARQGPLQQDLPFPYHPHVTIAHHLSETALDHAYESLKDFEAAFDVTEFHLYVHGDDGIWRPIQTFELTG
jgi:2'-5' RNA ligase